MIFFRFRLKESFLLAMLFSLFFTIIVALIGIPDNQLCISAVYAFSSAGFLTATFYALKRHFTASQVLSKYYFVNFLIYFIELALSIVCLNYSDGTVYEFLFTYTIIFVNLGAGVFWGLFIFWAVYAAVIAVTPFPIIKEMREFEEQTTENEEKPVITV